MVRDGIVFEEEDGQVIFNQYSFCELVKHLLVALVDLPVGSLPDSGTLTAGSASGWPMKKASAIWEKKRWTPLRDHFGHGPFRARLYPGTALTEQERRHCYGT